MLAVHGLALSVSVSSDLMGFAPYGRLTFFACAKKVSKETHPYIRPRLRRGSLVPSPLQGHDRMWPTDEGPSLAHAALATSMSLNPFHGDSTRPPEGDLSVVCEIAVEEQRQRPDAANFNSAKIMQARGPAPGAASGRGEFRAAKPGGRVMPIRSGCQSSPL